MLDRRGWNDNKRKTYNWLQVAKQIEVESKDLKKDSEEFAHISDHIKKIEELNNDGGTRQIIQTIQSWISWRTKARLQMQIITFCERRSPWDKCWTRRNTEGDETSYMWTFQERIWIHHTHIHEDKKRECQQTKKVLKWHGNILIVDKRTKERQRQEKTRRRTTSNPHNGRNVKDN
jgi:hypothetical protein